MGALEESQSYSTNLRRWTTADAGGRNRTMSRSEPIIARRAVLAAAALLPLAGCAEEDRAPATSPSEPASAPSAASSSTATSNHHEQLAELERKFGAVLGVYARLAHT